MLLEDYKDIHINDTIVVCGCGSSLNDFKNPEKHITFGVNDVSRLFDPTYLLVINPENGFKNNRYKYVKESKAKVIFSQYDLSFPHPCKVKIILGKKGGTNCDDGRVPYSNNSPYCAMVIAGYMGAKKIGIVGANTGVHTLTRSLDRINKDFKALGDYLAGRGVEIVNLSQQSLLTVFKKVDKL